jgi:adenylate cyclase class 2
MSTFEVEIKFQINNIAELEQRLQQQFGGAEFGTFGFGTVGFGESVTESDSFFQHPSRNFAQTDECLRLRKRLLSDGTSEYFLTYKGPKIDASTKTRQEIEMSITEPERWETLLLALGFYPTASVQKLRRRQTLTLNRRRVEIVLDTLPALPESTRFFLEMETLATAEEIEECRSLILDIADQLGLTEPIRDSYLKLVQNYNSTNIYAEPPHQQE